MSNRPLIKTILYIDGFNLYYGALKDTPYKWLNPVTLTSKVFPKNRIIATKFCSAKVSALPRDPDAPTRQMTYWRALKTIPNLKIIEGFSRTREIMAKVVNPPPPFIKIFKTEEKGSDVNLGAHLLLDAFQNKYDAAIVITGDSDLVTPIRMVNEHLNKAVLVINPQLLSGKYRRAQRRSNVGLHHAAKAYRPGIRDSQLSSAQFSDTLTDHTGNFTKPLSW